MECSVQAPESRDTDCSPAGAQDRLAQGTYFSLQEAEQELLARVKSTLALVGKGYSVALILRGRETEAPRLVPQVRSYQVICLLKT